MHKVLHISSKDRQTGSPSNFTLNLSQNYWLQAVKSIVVKQVTIPHVFYNITTDNNVFTYQIGGVPSSVAVLPGQYNITALLDALSTLMVAAGVVGWNGVVDATSNRIVFSSTTAIEYLSLSDGNDMATILGITQTNGSDVTTFTAQAIPRLYGVRNIVISSSALGENNYLASDQKIQDVIAVIPVVEAFGDMIHYVSQHSEIDDYDTLSKRNGKNISQIDIRVIDADTNQTLDLTNHDVDIICKVYY